MTDPVRIIPNSELSPGPATPAMNRRQAFAEANGEGLAGLEGGEGGEQR